MAKVLRQFLVFLLLLFAFTVVRFPYDSYSTDIISFVKREASRRKILVDIEELHLRMPSAVTFIRIGMLFPNPGSLPVPLVIDRGAIRAQPLPLLLLRTKFTGQAVLYGGSVDFTADKSIFGSAVDLRVAAKELALERHPLFAGVDARGTVKIDVDSQSFGSPQQQGSLALKVENASYGGGLLRGLVKIPEVSDIALSISAKLKGREFSIESCELLSSVGSASCRGTGEISTRGTLERLSGNATVRLAGEGVDAFSGYLALLAKRDPSEQARNWSVTWSVEGKQSKVTAEVSAP